MYQELVKQFKINNVNTDSLVPFYWSRLRDAINDSVNHAENGNHMGAALTMGVAREMVEALDGLFINGHKFEEITEKDVKNVDKK